MGVNQADGEDIVGVTGVWGAFAYYWPSGMRRSRARSTSGVLTGPRYSTRQCRRSSNGGSQIVVGVVVRRQRSARVWSLKASLK